MIVILLDMVALWFILNIFSDENWDDETGRVLFITIVIAITGALIIGLLTPIIGLFSIGTYVIVGGILLKLMARLEWNKAFQAMGAFLGFKIVVQLIFIFFLTR